MEKTLSIIIPTYNMENYLHRCLNSLVIKNSELLSNLEVLVINDGSKDASSVIAHTFEAQYPDIFRVLDKENGNYGSCINAGLPIASGKYVKILDADDYFCTEQFSCYLDCLKSIDADMIINNKYLVDTDGVIQAEWKVDLTPDVILGFSDILHCNQVLDLHKIAYRRTLLLDMEYRQTEGVSYSDTEWAVFPFSAIQTACYLPHTVYCYLQGREGQTVDPAIRSKALKSLSTIQFSLGDYMQRYQGPKERREFLYEKFIYDLLFVYDEFFIKGYYDKDEFRKFDAEIMSRYPEIQPSIDNHKWVSFIPNLQLVRDWREKKSIKYALEMGLIKSYLFLSKLKPSSNS